MGKIILQSLKTVSGKKSSGYLNICGTNSLLPATVICGEDEGKTVLITGGIHNAEYVGIQTAIDIAKEISPQDLRGNLIIVPLTNRSGFENRTMSLVYEDGKNLNRQFPGNIEGTLAEKISLFIENELFTLADYYIDLHCGDGFEALTPFVYCQGKATKEVCRSSLSMAKAVNVPYIVKSQLDSGGAYNYAGACGIPGILMERGGVGLWSWDEVDKYKADVKNVLRTIGVLAGEPKICADPKIFTQTIYDFSSSIGCWYPKYEVGDVILKGSVLGEVRDYFGNIISTCFAKKNGIVLFQTVSLNVLKNDPLIAYGVCDGEGEDI
ncbi:MAG: M14 family metallopeptidase [Clostridiales bacterium]